MAADAGGWVAMEFEGMDLGDERLNRRAVKLTERLAAKPMASIPAACGGWGETAAAYRFLSQDEMSWQDIIQPHWQRTQERMAAQAVVLCLQDTTELDFNGQEIAGLGPLSYEAQRGMYLHPTYAVTPEREPLGLLDAWMWARNFKDDEGERAPAGESTRWIEGYERVAERAAELPDTRLVYVADRESDIIALMLRAQELGTPADWLVRAQHNRALPEGGKLWERLSSGTTLGEVAFTLSARRGQAAREVRQAIWVERVTLRDPQSGRTVEVTGLVAREVAPPAGVEALEWRLLSNRPIAGLDEARTLIDWYRARWEIELYFHVLKNGCRVEALQLGRAERIERALALYMVVAWRIAFLMRMGRNCPDLDAALFFERDEWRGTYILNGKKPPAAPPRLNDVIRLIARLGGFLGRKGDGEPGVKTIWLGLQRVTDFAAGLRHAREFGEL